MKEGLTAEWALSLSKMLPVRIFSDAEKKIKLAQLATYIDSASKGAFQWDDKTASIVQRKKLPWGYLFDVIKCAREFVFVVKMPLPPKFKLIDPEPKRGTMLAHYEDDDDAISLFIYTEGKREELAGYDGWGREPDELEVVAGLRDREGNWIDELHIEWI